MSSKIRDALLMADVLIAIASFDEDVNMEEVEKIRSEIKAALAEPLKNCEVGTAEEQNLRHGEWCRKHGIDGAMDVPCASPNWHCHLCFAHWSQMPYEKGEEK